MSGADIALPTARMLAAYPCSRDLWLKLHAIGQEMVAGGSSKDVTPLRAYQHQRYRAGRRGIAWEISLADWWSVWQQSGLWPLRGVGRGYMMCRIKDLGPYRVGNVFIGPGADNLSAAAKKCDLPIGVALRSGKKPFQKPYRAYCNIGGKQRHLGVFRTVEEARAAYVEGLAADASISGAAA